jgi:hypothetical protein
VPTSAGHELAMVVLVVVVLWVVVPLLLLLDAEPDELLELVWPEELEPELVLEPVLEPEAAPPVPVDPAEPPVPAEKAELHPAATRTPPTTDQRKARIRTSCRKPSSRPGRMARPPHGTSGAGPVCPWSRRLPVQGCSERGLSW